MCGKLPEGKQGSRETDEEERGEKGKRREENQKFDELFIEFQNLSDFYYCFSNCPTKLIQPIVCGSFQ